MNDIPQELVDKMMVKCGRRCCICRRFRPIKLQVHHIRERSKGGGDEEDNLIVTCMSCHSDVHTKVPFARRFSEVELKGHRDALIRAVEQGKLPSVDTDDTDEAIKALLLAMRSKPTGNSLSPEAVEILLQAANCQGNNQGSVLQSLHTEGLTIQAGDWGQTIGHDNGRLQAKYKHGLKQLVDSGLLEPMSGDVSDLTYEGYLVADELMAGQGGV